MEILYFLILGWFGTFTGLLIALHGRGLAAAWREPVLASPVLIIESDDWGPGPAEDAGALHALSDTLAAIRDAAGRPAVMTLGVVSSVPRGAVIDASSGPQYVRRTLADPDFAPIVMAISVGCRCGVFALQRHGLEHFWPASLLARLRGGSSSESAAEADALQRWLNSPEVRTEGLPAYLQSRWIDCARLPSSPLAAAEVECAVHEEADLLRQVFGDVPDVAVPNTFVWDDRVEQAWAANGVRCVVTPGRRYEGRDAAGRLVGPTRRIRNGERGCGDVCYVVRDVYFEPLRGHRAERVWEALAEKGAEGRPVLLETHRANFLGPIPVRDGAIAELERALRGALVRHPDLQFMSTAQLAGALRDPGSPLRVQALRQRLVVWCVRTERDPEAARLLRFSGLGVLLRAARYLIGDVTFRRSPGVAGC